MTPSTPKVTPLRQRMLDGMRMRKFGSKTQAACVRAVRQLTVFLGRSPDTVSAEDLRRFQLHRVDHGTSPSTINATISALKFFCEVTLDKPGLLGKMHPVHVPRTLPAVRSREEVGRLIAAAPDLKAQTALSIAYGAGLRANEVVSLKVGDIDSQRMTLRVESLATRSRIPRCMACSRETSSRAGWCDDRRRQSAIAIDAFRLLR
jgi:site-specific recombinase XerD